jgi:regulator of protease activity HflC (stomatin/prohibitin superfamily)
MGWFVFTFIVFVVAIGLFVAGPRLTAGQRRAGYHGTVVPLWFFGVGASVLLLFWAATSIQRSVHQIDTGHIGLVYTFGKITNQRPAGWAFTAPWQSIQQANIQTQSVKPETDCPVARQCLSAASKQSQNVFISTVLNFHVDPVNIQQLYTNIGPDYVEKVVQPRVSQVLKEETAKYDQAADVLPHREDIRQAVTKRLTEELSARGIAVEDFLLTNIGFDKEFEAAITSKAVAEQNALAEQNKVAIEAAKAEQAKQQGIAKANALREEANGQAAANVAINASLTPLLVQFQALQKLGPDLKIAVIPSGQGLIIDPSTLLSGLTPASPAPSAVPTPAR